MKRTVALGFGAALWLAAGQGWLGKQISEWSVEDARQVLFDSPWSKTVKAARLPELTPAQRSDGGASGGGKGSGIAGLAGNLVTGIHRTSEAAKTAAAGEVATIRWESALPVRAAEMKAGMLGAPDWEGDYRAISVSGVAGETGASLRQLAVLKRADGWSLRPVRAVVMQEPGGLSAVLYLFPKEKLLGETKQLEFSAQIGRVCVSTYFVPDEMWFAGKREL